MAKEVKKNPVGRPTIKRPSGRKVSRTCSITPDTEKKAIKYFKTLGNAIEQAIILKEQDNDKTL